jgi:thioredoxin 1
MLQTSLKHILTSDEHAKLITDHENVMICCGRMGPMCIPVYGIMAKLRNTYTQVQFADMEFDTPDAHVIRNAPECKGFMGLPFTVYYKNGKLVKATGGIQTEEQVTNILDSIFGK